jgi:type I restriction enzyme R subunit
VIVDEAHSSQSGEAAAEMKGILAKDHIAEQAKAAMEERGYTEDWQDTMLREMAKRAQQPTLSFFAFTATPKPATLKVFGTPGSDGKPHPFHLYSMRQAIQEGFILNVLANYTTYKAYYKLVKSAEEDPQVQKRAATKTLARYMSLNEHHIARKVDVMLEHFWRHTRHKISGRAKAMVVTGSRLEAYQYYRAFQRAVEDKGYAVGLLVAFSGEIVDPDTDDKWTEPKLNGFKESELPDRFESAEYRILLVADEQAKRDAVADAGLQQASTVNELDTWRFVFDRKYEDLLIDRLQRNPKIVSWALSDPEHLKMIRDLYAAEVFDACRSAAASQADAPS